MFFNLLSSAIGSEERDVIFSKFEAVERSGIVSVLATG